MQTLTGHTTGSSATGEFVVVYDTNSVIKISSRLSGSITTGPVIYRSVALSSKSWAFNGDYYIMGFHASTTQATRYLLRVPTTTTAPTTAAPLAQFAVRQGGSNFISGTQVGNPSAGVFTVAIDYQTQVSTGGFNPDANAIQLATITHLGAQQTTLGPPKEAIGSLFVPGGDIGQFDGQVFAEAAFAYGPEAPVLTPNVAGANNYQYKILYSYVDAQGKLWRSADSAFATIGTNAVIGGGGSVTVACPTLRVTGRTNVKIEVYRTALGTTVDYRKIGTVANDITVDSVNLVDTTTDAARAALEPIYTDGGVLENDTMSGAIAEAVWDNRFWFVPMDDPQSVAFSGTFDLQHGLIFNEDDYVIDVKDVHGPITGLGVIDGQLVITKADATYVVQGQGPNALGQGGSYAAAFVANGVGCVNPQAMLETKDGLIFRANTAKPTFYLLDRGLSLQPLGGAQRYVSETIVGSAFVPTLQQAQFYTVSGRTLVYDLVSQLWSTHTGQPANTATIWNGSPVYFNSSAGQYAVADLTGGTYTELGAFYNQVITWPWLSLAALKGYERFYRLQILGELGAGASGNASPTLALYKDFVDASPLVTRAMADALTSDVEVRYSAKLSAVKAKLTIADDVAGSAGWKVSGLALIWGQKQGLAKRPSTARL